MPSLTTLRPELDTLREFFTPRLPWTPHDFIFKSAQFMAADRAMQVEHFTRPISEENDLRTLYHDGDLSLALFAERLPWDSAFFGYDVARLHAVLPVDEPVARPMADYTPALKALVNAAQARGIKYLFASAYPEDLALIRGLCDAGFTLIETRATYHRSLTDYAYPERYAARPAVPADVPTLAEAARSMVNIYDRFHADPFIHPTDADRLMVRWVEASINEGFADVTIVPDAPNPAAFCTVKLHRDKWERWGLKLAQPVFSAVAPPFQGWYIKIISEINYYLKEAGAEHCYLITQATNRAVVRSWEKLGFSYGRGEHIFRIHF